MTRRAFPWSRLGIDPTSDTGAIRKAYADALRATNPDEDIAGYAELRRARDQALWLAAQEQRATEQPEDEGEVYGLGSLGDDPDEEEWDAYGDGAWDVAPGIQPSLAAPPANEPAPAPALTEAQARAQAAWNRLLVVLYPEGEPSDAAVTHAELDDGLAALGLLIDRAEEADIEEHDALDSALADLFARTWPRSAPFVEPANAAFHWLDESGALEERFALRFLNDRLKGMRFHEKVLQPGHPLHKAWVELARPGRAGMLDRLRVSRLDVHKLIVGIRERYPELESHLDPVRVASWEGQGAGSTDGYSNAGRGFGGALLFVLLFFAMIRALAVLIGPSEDPGSSGLPPPVPILEPSDAEIDAEVAGVFGQDTDMAAVRAADPVFADQLRLAIRNAADNGGTRAFVRHKALQSGEVAKFDELVTLAELKRLWLNAAKESSGQCQDVMVGDFRSLPLELGSAQSQRETELLRRLLDAKVLSHQGRTRGGSFSVPGWVVDQTIKRSGLSDAQLTAALQDPEHSSRCLVELTMLGVVLKEPGGVSAELLRGL